MCKIDQMVHKLVQDCSLEVEIHQYRVAVLEEQRLLKCISELEQTLGTVMSHKLGSAQCLEAAAALE